MKQARATSVSTKGGKVFYRSHAAQDNSISSQCRYQGINSSILHPFFLILGETLATYIRTKQPCYRKRRHVTHTSTIAGTNSSCQWVKLDELLTAQSGVVDVSRPISGLSLQHPSSFCGSKKEANQRW